MQLEICYANAIIACCVIILAIFKDLLILVVFSTVYVSYKSDF